MQSPSSQYELIDLAHLSDLANGHVEEVKNLIEMYVRSTENNLKKLRQALKKGDAQQFCNTAHAAAGTSALLGIYRMRDLLRSLEQLGCKGDLKKASLLMPRVERLFYHVNQFLEVSQRPSARLTSHYERA